MEFVERPNIRAVEWLLNVLSADFVRNYQDYRGNKVTYTHVKKVLQQFLKHKELKVQYFKSRHDSLGVLRSYSASIQGFPKEFRGLLCAHMTDYDIKNCHPSILLNLCKKFKIECKYLEEFVSHRDELYSSSATSKGAIFISLFSNKPLKYKTSFMAAFDTEIKLAQQQMIEHYPDLYEMARVSNETDKKQNTIGTFMSYVCQFHENEIINACMLHFKVSDPILMFDGFMTVDVINPEKLNEFVKHTFDMELEFVVKGHDKT